MGLYRPSRPAFAEAEKLYGVTIPRTRYLSITRTRERRNENHQIQFGPHRPRSAGGGPAFSVLPSPHPRLAPRLGPPACRLGHPGVDALLLLPCPLRRQSRARKLLERSGVGR